MERWTLKQLPIFTLTVSLLLTSHPQYVQAGTAADEAARARLAAQAAREEEIDSLLRDGVEFYRNKRSTEALTNFAQVLRLDPHNASAHFSMGIVKEAQGNYVEALENYSQAAHEEPSNSEYAQAVAAISGRAQRQSQLGAQHAEFKQLTANANAAWKRGEYNSALDLYLQVDAREPNKALVKYNIGSIYLMLKDRTNALTFYQEAHKLEPSEPKYAKAYAELAAVVKKETREQEKAQQQAQKEYEQAQQPQPNKHKHPSGQTAFSAGNQAPPYMQQQPRQSASQFNAPQMVSSPPGQGASGSAYGNIGTTPIKSPFASMIAPGQAPAQQYVSRSHYGLAPNQTSQFQSTVQPLRSQNSMSSFGITGSNNGQGVTVTGVSSRAASGGLRNGDDIRAVDGAQISNEAEINSVLSKANVSNKVKFLILRNGNLAVLEL